MKKCEYYQRKFSDALDEGASIDNELKNHLDDCEDCTRFYNTAQTQSNLIRHLPKVNHQTKENIKTSFITKIWKSKISIPLPAAAAVILLVIGSVWLTGNDEQVSPQDIEVQERLKESQHVQFVKFEPQSAVLVESN